MNTNHKSVFTITLPVLMASFLISGCFGSSGSSDNRTTTTSRTPPSDLNHTIPTLGADPDVMRLFQHVPQRVQLFENTLDFDGSVSEKEITFDNEVEWQTVPANSDQFSLDRDDDNQRIDAVTGENVSSSNGDLKITATRGTGANPRVTEIPVSILALNSLELSSTRQQQRLPEGQTTCLTATGLFGDLDETQDVTDLTEWSLDDDTAGSISDEGCLSANSAPSSVTVTATFGAQSDSLTFELVDAEIATITIDNRDYHQGDRLTASISYQGDVDLPTDITPEVAWSSVNEDLVDILSDGSAVALGVGQTDVTATLRNADGDTLATDTQPVSVLPDPDRARRFQVTAEPDVLLTTETTRLSANAEAFDGSNARETAAQLRILQGPLLLQGTADNRETTLDTNTGGDPTTIEAGSSSRGRSLVQVSALDSYAIGQVSVRTVEEFDEFFQPVIVVDNGFDGLQTLPPGFRLMFSLFNPSNRDFRVTSFRFRSLDGSIDQTKTDLVFPNLRGKGNFFFITEVGQEIPNEGFIFEAQVETVDTQHSFTLTHELEAP